MEKRYISHPSRTARDTRQCRHSHAVYPRLSLNRIIPVYICEQSTSTRVAQRHSDAHSCSHCSRQHPYSRPEHVSPTFALTFSNSEQRHPLYAIRQDRDGRAVAEQRVDHFVLWKPSLIQIFGIKTLLCGLTVVPHAVPTCLRTVFVVSPPFKVSMWYRGE